MPTPEIRVFDTLGELFAALGLPFRQDDEITVHRFDDLHRAVPFRSPLFRANYYSFLFLESGRGRYFLDDQAYRIKARTIYFTNPGHVKGFAIEQKIHGFIITLSERFLKQNAHPAVFEEFPFLLAETVPPDYVSPALFGRFADVCSQMLSEYQGDSPYRQRILGNQMMILLLLLKEHFWADERRGVSVRGSKIVLDFKKNLERNFRDFLGGQSEKLLQPRDYARLQLLHPGYLSTVIKNRTGKSINAWINEKLLTESQARLTRTTRSSWPR